MRFRLYILNEIWVFTHYFNFIILVNLFCWVGVVKTPRMSTCIYQMQCSNP